MDTSPWATYTSRTLPAPSSLTRSSTCPTRELIALGPALHPVASTSELPAPPAQTKISLYRTAGNADLVWEWIPKPPTVDPAEAAAAPAAPAGGLRARMAMMNKGKGKETASVGKIEEMCWDPQGNYLAVAVSIPSATPPKPASRTLHLLSVENGLSSLAPLNLPTTSAITHLSWHALPSSTYSPDPLLSSSAISLVLKLPALPPIVVQDPQALLAAGLGAAAGTMFGQAKNAALQKEREKEAGRALSIPVSVGKKGFPVLLPDRVQEERIGSEREGRSILLIGDRAGAVHVYLGGSVFLGTVQVELGSQIIAASLLSTSPVNTLHLAVTISTPSIDEGHSLLASSAVSLPLPASLDVFAQQCSAMQRSLTHAFEALQEVRVLWDESRRVGKAWLARLGDASKTHGETLPPISQLLLLLLNGRPTQSVHDFLASKMNERVMAKFEQATGTAIEKLRMVTFMSVAPAVERVVVLLEELRAWSQWPEKFGVFNLPTSLLSSLLQLCSTLLLLVSQLEAHLLEQDRQFHLFSSWLHYELDKLAQSEGSDLKPSARFQPVGVAAFLRSFLGSETGGESGRYLSFGRAIEGLEGNREVADAEKWFEGLEEERKRRGEGTESLAAVMRRMKEELKGQRDATLLGQQQHQGMRDAGSEGMLFGQGDEVMREMPLRETEGKGREGTPKSVVVMLHLLAGKLGGLCADAVARIADAAEVKDAEELGGLEDGGERSVRERFIQGERWSAWLSGSALFLSRWATQRAVAACKLDIEGTGAVQVLDFDFLSDDELVLLLAPAQSDGSQTILSILPLSAPLFQPYHTSRSPTATPHLPISATHTLEPHFSPVGISLGSRERAGRKERTICVLGGEGRRLVVLGRDKKDLAGEDDDVDEESRMLE